MTRWALSASVLLAGFLALAAAADPKADAAAAKKALQEVGDFVGQWNLTAETKTTGRITSWKETAGWAWKFKGDDAWITLDLKDGRYFAKGELRYVPAKKQYQLTATGKDKQEQVFAGEYKKGKLILERTDTKNGDVHRLSLNTLSEGVRFSLQYEVQSGGKGLFESVYKAAGTKEGESFAGGKASKKGDCIVSGGTGTIPVSFMGKSYFVCCSGCKEEFDANPKKYVDAFEKAKK